jgi:DNA-binding protein YbaB
MTDPLSDTMRMIENWERDAEEKAARFQAMSDRVEQISITESVGPVSVTVGHNGIPTDITMADGVREMEPREIAANVMAAMRKAQSRYPAQLAEILAETVGDDDPAGQHIVATAERNFPAPEEEETDEDPMRFSDVEVDEQPPPPSPPRPPRARDDEDDDGDVTIFRE